jgi:hypothetical protein
MCYTYKVKTKDILLNGIFRCGNTYLAFCFEEAIRINLPNDFDFHTRWHIHNHSHNPILLKFKDPENETIHFCIFRNPIQLVPSYFMFHYDLNNINSLNDDELKNKIRNISAEYNKYLKHQIKYGYATAILFDDIINDIDSVLEKIFNTLEVKYVNKIDTEKVKKFMSDLDHSRYPDPEELYRNFHLPREEQYPGTKSRILSTFKDMPEFKILMDQYLEIEKRAKELTPLTIYN